MRREGLRVKHNASSLIALAVVTALAGCGEETKTTTTDSINAAPQVEILPPAPMSSYSGPGSSWQYDLNEDGSFSVSRDQGADSELIVSGTYQATAAGFLSMTVDSATGVNSGSVGDSLWALEVPNVLLLLSPVSAAEESYVPMVSGRECPNTDLSNNWVSVRFTGSSNAATDTGSFFGMFGYSAGRNEATLSSQHALTNGNPDQGARSLGFGYCDSGAMQTSDSVIHLSPSGAAVAEVGSVDGSGGPYLLALPTDTMVSIDDFDGNYAGVLADHGVVDGGGLHPVSVSCTAGICSGSIVADIGTGATTGATFTVDLYGTTNSPSNGFITGSHDLGGAGGNLACAVDAEVDVTGQRLISCVGQSPTAEYATVNLVLASTD